MSVKIDRLEHKFAIEISTIIEEEIKDERIDFVTITAVSITNDLSFAKVYVTVLDDSKKEEYIGTIAEWEYITNEMKSALKEMNIKLYYLDFRFSML